MTTRVDARPAGGDRPGRRHAAGDVVQAPSAGPGRRRDGERLHELFEERCDSLRAGGRGTQLAVDAGAETLTYGELDGRANQLARHLLEHGVEPGDRVALLFDVPVRAYVAMLAVLKAGAAYVPLDPGFPPDRLAYIVEDAGARLVLSLSGLRGPLADVPARVLCLDEADALVAAEPAERLGAAERADPVDDLCYIIYTSGSTGRPKGVAIEHGAICNFVRVAAEAYGIEPSDRVYQGMTIAFDFSVEEIWVPLMAGATLVPKPGATALLGDDLAEFLVANGVTALCCVPTLLTTLDDVPGLRFLLVSGEACPQDLVARWHRPGRRFLNVYGPTEATVTATWTELHPDRPVTLGVPLPTYSVVILDPDRPRALAPGEMGEIGIAGVGLARGYVNRDDLTQRAFIPDFLAIPDNPSGRIYRTGDLGRVNEDGEIEYHGRIDTQVKIRGYRIELTEIESVLLQVPGILQAVVDTHEPEPGVVQLVAYYSVRGGADVDRDAVHAQLRERLPAYMVPAYLERLAAIPMLPSDKADRKRLPPPSGPPAARDEGRYVAPATDAERAFAEVLAPMLGRERASVESHIFDDLGATSLLMARFCAAVRKRPDLPSISMRDVYANPTIRALAAATAGMAAAPAAAVPAARRRPRPRASGFQYALCGTIQLALFLAVTYVGALVLVAGFEWIAAADGWTGLYVRALAYGALLFAVGVALPVAAKWVLVGRWKREEIPVWTLRYVRFWFVRTLIRSSPMVLFAGSPPYLLYLRALGARIGRDVVIFSRTVPVCTDLLTVGDGTIIRAGSALPCYRAVDGVIETGPVTLGRDVFVGEGTVLEIGASLGDGAQLGHASSLHAGQAVPAGECVHGSPAVPAQADYRVVPPARCGLLRRTAYSAFLLARTLVLYLPIVFVAAGAWLPDLFRHSWLTPTRWDFYVEAMTASLAIFVAGLVIGLLFVLTVPRLLNLGVRVGAVYPLYGVRYLLHAMVTRMTNARFFMDLFGDSSYIVHFLRALGYRLTPVEQTGSNFGKELSHGNPYATSVGTGTIVSDGLSIMNVDFSSTSFRVSPTGVGPRTFIGNNVVFPAGARTGENCLLATKALVPIDGPVRSDVGLLGSPPFEIPRTVERDPRFEALRTGDEFRRRLRAKNRYNAATIGLTLLVRWLQFAGALLIVLLAADVYLDAGALAVAGALLAILVWVLLSSVVVERALMRFGRLEPQYCSIYEPYFWWHERLWKLTAPTPFSGTPFKNVLWRLLGVRIGRRVFDDGCFIPERTLVALGDECTLNAASVIQCHSMEDGVFKSEATSVGARCTLGISAFVHYGVTIGDGATIDADAFLMKGEEVPAGACWRGNPAQEHAETPPPAASLLGELRAAPGPQLSPESGVALSLFPLDACHRREGELAELLSDDERAEAAAAGSAGRRRELVVSRALVRLILSTDWRPDVAPRDWRLVRGQAGKLALAGPAGADLELSISHTRRVLAVAVSQAYEVGVDVEGAEQDAVWSALTPAERGRLAALPAAERAEPFVRMWTLKEAFVKCTGAGAAQAFERLETSLDPPAVAPGGGRGGDAASAWFHQERWDCGREYHWVAVAARPRRRSRPRRRMSPVRRT